MRKSVGVFARIHFLAFATEHQIWKRFGLDFGRVWAPFWQGFGSMLASKAVSKACSKQAHFQDAFRSRKIPKTADFSRVGGVRLRPV